MPPAGYPAFLQYLQSGRVRNVAVSAITEAVLALTLFSIFSKRAISWTSSTGSTPFSQWRKSDVALYNPDDLIHLPRWIVTWPKLRDERLLPDGENHENPRDRSA